MSFFIEVGSHQVHKHSQTVCGDVFLSKKIPGENRIISVLADGLGSGIKANVLATLTATMVSNYITNDIDIQRAAELIMETLPICKVRKIGYSTFTIVDIDNSGNTRIIEHDNPSYVYIRDGKIYEHKKKLIEIHVPVRGNSILKYSEFTARPGDRIVFFSDGVSQSGIGKKITPLGWEKSDIKDFIYNIIQTERDISATNLSRKIVIKALQNDDNKALDDITTASIYFRRPRKVLIVSGPPFDKNNDIEFARITREFEGKKVICGGTTSNILARELQIEIKVNLDELKQNPFNPPSAEMKGFDLVTEGTITLTNFLKILKNPNDDIKDSSAKKLFKIITESDLIHFLVGTRINEAHQDPSLPLELEIRRNLIKRIKHILEDKYMKQVELKFI